jgi:dipeptide/tripeptide permease
MIPFEHYNPVTYYSRVGNIGSLSWFATVYLESHVGFTSAYGLTLVFLVFAVLLIVFGKRRFGKKAFSTCLVIQVVDIAQ